jgi:hypothetical protein
VSAPYKKSFSSVSSAILACSVLTSTAGYAGAVPPDPKTPEVAPSSCAFQVVIWSVSVKMLGQLGDRPIAFDGRQCHLRLEGQ